MAFELNSENDVLELFEASPVPQSIFGTLRLVRVRYVGVRHLIRVGKGKGGGRTKFLTYSTLVVALVHRVWHEGTQ